MQGQTDILVIDDDRDLVETVQIALESKGFDVRKAFNGKEGLAEIQKKPPDLIVLDVMMSTDTEGFDLAYKLKNNPRYDNIPIVMVTGFTRKMMEDGPERFQHILGESWPVSQLIEKPIDPEDLIRTIETFLNR